MKLPTLTRNERGESVLRIEMPLTWATSKRGTKRVSLSQNRLNRLHWGRKKFIREQVENYIKKVLLAAGIKVRSPWKRVSVQIWVFHRQRRKPDQDNYSTFLLNILKGWIFEDDNYQQCEQLPTGFAVDRQHPKMVAIITHKENANAPHR